jgi:hypothetical protein
MYATFESIKVKMVMIIIKQSINKNNGWGNSWWRVETPIQMQDLAHTEDNIQT